MTPISALSFLTLINLMKNEEQNDRATGVLFLFDKENFFSKCWEPVNYLTVKRQILPSFFW